VPKVFLSADKSGEDILNHTRAIASERFQYGILTLNFDLDLSEVNTDFCRRW